MSILKSVLGGLSGKGKLSAAQLNDLVEQKSSTGFGGFVDLNNDLGLMVDGRSNLDPEIFMPYLYARRSAAAGMFSQGAIEKSNFDQVESLFFSFMAQVGSDLTKDEQVTFQEESLDRALELEANYLTGTTRRSTSLMVVAAKQGISLRDALVASFDRDEEELEEMLGPVMYGHSILKPEFCMGFFATGWWEPDDDFNTTATKYLKYLESLGFAFEPREDGINRDSKELRFKTFEEAAEWAKQDPNRVFTRSADDSCYVPRGVPESKVEQERTKEPIHQSNRDTFDEGRRLGEIAEVYVNQANYSLDHIGMEIELEAARSLIEDTRSFVPDEIFHKYDIEIVAAAFMIITAENAAHYESYDAVCLISASIIWAASNLIDQGSLREVELSYVGDLRSRATNLIDEHGKKVDAVAAQNWIAATMLAQQPSPLE
jgi:hypothetical protein